MRSKAAAKIAGEVLLTAGAIIWLASRTLPARNGAVLALAPAFPARIEAPVEDERPALALVPAELEPATEQRRYVATARRVLSLLGLLLTIAAVVFWALFLRPQSLGGPAGYVLVSGKSMEPRYHTGDMVLVEHQSSYHVGELIAYHVPKGDPMAGAQVIHRIVGGDAQHGFVVQGDNRTAPDTWRPKPADIVGAKALRIPDAVIVLQYLRSPLVLGLLAACFVFAHILGGSAEEEAKRKRPALREAQAR
jgi:signal peptidase